MTLLDPAQEPLPWVGLSPPYSTIVVDPPWQYRVTKDNRQTDSTRTWPEDHYPSMTMREIADLPVGDLAARDAHLYLWVTNPRLAGDRSDDSLTPFDILKEWGFEYKTLLTWFKPMGLGTYFRGCTEPILFAVKGRLGIPPSTREPNFVMSGRGRHSEKPDAFYDLVERVSPGPYVDLFARHARVDWDVWGNECEGAA